MTIPNNSEPSPHNHDDNRTAHADTQRLTAWVHGHVQGVGFRWWVRCRAGEYGLVGSATNYPDGRVLVAVEGPSDKLHALAEDLQKHPGGSRPGRVDKVFVTYGDARGIATGFECR